VSRGEACLSDLTLDELVRGELAAAAEGRAHLDGCERCRARLAAIEDTRAQFLADMPRLSARGPLPSSQRSRRRARVRGLIAATTVLAAASLVLWLRPRPLVERTKGGTQLTLYVRHDGKVRLAAPGEIVAPGDTLQLTYSSERTRYLAVLSLDGAAHANVYFPDGERALELGRARESPLPRSTVLDGVLGKETLFGLFCDTALFLPPVRREIEARGALSPLEGCDVVRLTFEKRAPP
jgi:hypothetical protein